MLQIYRETAVASLHCPVLPTVPMAPSRKFLAVMEAPLYKYNELLRSCSEESPPYFDWLSGLAELSLGGLSGQWGETLEWFQRVVGSNPAVGAFQKESITYEVVPRRVSEHVFRPRVSPQDWIASWLPGLQEREGQAYLWEPTRWQTLSLWVSSRLGRGDTMVSESLEGTVEIQLDTPVQRSNWALRFSFLLPSCPFTRRVSMRSSMASHSPSLGLHCIWSAVVTEWVTTHSLDSHLSKPLEVLSVPLTVCNTGHRIKQRGLKKGGGGTISDAQNTFQGYQLSMITANGAHRCAVQNAS